MIINLHNFGIDYEVKYIISYFAENNSQTCNTNEISNNYTSHDY